jgi:hypothetical protein
MNRYTAPSSRGTLPVAQASRFGEEDLVEDARSNMKPAQMVEQRLVSLLRNTAHPYSHLQTSRNARRNLS